MTDASADELLLAYIEAYLPTDKAREVYDDSIRRARTELCNPGDLSEEAVTRVVQPYLYRWGVMGRPLGKDDARGWQTRLATAVRKHAAEIDAFRRLELANVNLAGYRERVVGCFESLRTATTPIAAAKVLHLLCPLFFPPWDTDIANAVRAERTTRQSCERFGGLDYYLFMLQVQHIATKHKTLLRKKSDEMHRSPLKLVDDFLWWAAHRPLYHLRSMVELNEPGSEGGK